MNQGALSYWGQEFEQYASLTHLCVDGVEFVLHAFWTGGGLRQAQDGDDNYLLMKCSHLERLSLKDATFTYRRRPHNGCAPFSRDVSQYDPTASDSTLVEK